MSPHLTSFLLEAERATVWLFLLGAIFVPLERFFAQKPQSVFRRQFAADLGYYFLSNLLSNALVAAMTGTLAAAIYRVLPSAVVSFGHSLTLWQRILATLLVGEFGFYWGHRWSHEWPLLWRFHIVHHAPEEVDWLTSTRGHPVDILITRFCGYTLIYACGLAQTDAGPATTPVLLLGVLTVFWGFFIHANVRWRFGWLEWLISTPAFHRWHHTNDEHRDMNYASTLPLWDWVFGTMWLPRQGVPPVFGTDHKIAETMIGQLALMDAVEAARR
jgi:sterol desaturase/sphingolipid hydroxylase (fatty acid hydroxylase superfamily)